MNALDFNSNKRRRQTDVIYPGDCVIWKDYDDTRYITKVLHVIEKHLKREVDFMPLVDKDVFVLEMEHGLSIDGTIVIAKHVKK